MRTPGAVVAGVLACALIAGAPALADGAERRTTPRAAPADDGRDLRPEHTSDNQPGWIAPPLTSARRAAPQRLEPTSRQIVPGVVYTQWDQTDARGPVEAHLLAVKVGTPGLRLDYADAGSVRSVATVPQILKVDGAAAGVNGDFFDIGRTGAPLGLGKDRQHGLLHGRASGWNSAFYLDNRGRPGIGQLPLALRVVGHPEINLTSMNSPYVASNSVGLYTKRWGGATGYSLTEGQTKRVVGVWLKAGKVVRVARKITGAKPITGNVLIGRGSGATALRALKPGTRVQIGKSLAGAPRVVITGNQVLVDDGIVRVIDDRVMHPRTAVGVDHDTGEVLLLVVDGRSKASRGYTMLELANLMVDLGADEALNLDGGGSTTMVARGGKGRNRVVNTPSDGGLRRVTNALEVIYQAP